MIQNVRRLLPMRLLSTSTSTLTLPPNLTLPDLSVLEPPKPSLITPIEQNFPTKFTQTSASIMNFMNPEEKSNETAYLDPRVFGVAIRQDIIHQIVRYQRAQIRQPQCTKRISEIRGSTRKLYQQKGSGRARVGQLRSAIRRGGMKSHGPVLRDFSFDLNRKTKALGMMVAIAAKFREGNLHIVDKIQVSVVVFPASAFSDVDRTHEPRH
jgi:ribosomal protein L4